MRALLVALRGHADVDLEKLSSNMKGHLNAIKQIHIGIDTEGGRSQLNALIDEIFGDINDSNVLPNTVASFFRGCRMSNCNGISMGCTPHCANALPSDPNLTGFAPCDSAVYILKNGVLELSTHGSEGNCNAYVYVGSNFRGYTAAMVRQLAQNGVRRVKTVHLENGKCGQMSPDFIDIDIIGGGGKGDGNCDSGWGGQWWWWVILIILAILIIGLIWALIARGRSSTPKSDMAKTLSTGGVNTSVSRGGLSSLAGLGTGSAGSSGLGGMGSAGSLGSAGLGQLPSQSFGSIANLPQVAAQNIGSIANLPQVAAQNIGSIANLPQVAAQNIGSIGSLPQVASQNIGGLLGSGSSGLGGSMPSAGSSAFSPSFFNNMSGAIGSPLLS
jgi:hypothetical protein